MTYGNPEVSAYAGLGRETRALFDLSGRTAVVTGGGAGIGRAVSIGFAWFGAAVAVLDRDEGAASRVSEEITANGGRAVALAVDITDLPALEGAASHVEAALGPVDICFASAGGGLRRGIFAMTPDEWHQIVELNLAGTWNTARVFGRGMVERRGGKFISVASIHGHVGDPDQSAYASAKSGVVGLTRALAMEWASANVQVNCVSPSHVKTQRVQSILDDQAEYDRLRARSPVGRFGEPWELIGPAVFLASDASGFVTGQALLVDGGWTAT